VASANYRSVAHPLNVIQAESTEARLAAIARLVAEWQPVLLVLACPPRRRQRTRDDAVAKNFARKLESHFNLAGVSGGRVAHTSTAAESNSMHVAFMARKNRALLDVWPLNSSCRDFSMHAHCLTQHPDRTTGRRHRAHPHAGDLIVGIHTGGVWVAERLHGLLKCSLPLACSTSRFYRDDFFPHRPAILSEASNLPFDWRTATSFWSMTCCTPAARYARR